MFKTIWQKVLSLFGKTTQSTNQEFSDNDRYAIQYESTRDINITAMFSNKLSNFVVDESVIEVEAKNKRAELLSEIIKSVGKGKKKIISRVFGTGGIVLVPYVKNGKLFYSKIAQNRLSINEMQGEKIVDATLLSDSYTVNSLLSSTTYYRWTDYKIQNNFLVIEQRYTNSDGSKVDKPVYWENVTDYYMIPNVDRVAFAYIKSPVDNRQTDDLYGVPITYGCDKTIRKILRTLDQIEREFDLKEAFVGADITMFDGKDALPTNGIYKKFNAGEETFWEVFDPAIRDSSYFNKLMNYFALLEKEVGTSRGILTDPITTYQNVDEVRRALKDTLSIINDMRENFRNGIEDFLYACDVLANYYNLSPMGEYDLKTTWSYSLIESYLDTFEQFNIGLSKGYVKKAETRNLLMDETMEESEKAIKEIEEEQKKNNPSISQLLGTNKLEEEV